MSIPPIETTYNGVRFRSRTEARWAIVFDRLGIHWQYEPEGFKTAAGWYVPDFWLEELHAFVEVKDHAAQWSGNAMARCQALADGSDRCVVLLDEFTYWEWRLRCCWPGELDGYIDLRQSLERGRPWWESLLLAQEEPFDDVPIWPNWQIGIADAVTHRFDWKRTQ